MNICTKNQIVYLFKMLCIYLDLVIHHTPLILIWCGNWCIWALWHTSSTWNVYANPISTQVACVAIWKKRSFSNQTYCLYHYKAHLRTQFMGLNCIKLRFFSIVFLLFYLERRTTHCNWIKVFNSFQKISKLFALAMKMFR